MKPFHTFIQVLILFRRDLDDAAANNLRKDGASRFYNLWVPFEEVRNHLWAPHEC
jgi:hypothetical protein